MSRTGRRPGTTGTREEILTAARRAFGARGYDASSLRAIAAEVGVDPSLLIHYFATKQALFIEATGFPFRPSDILAELEGMPLRRACHTLVSLYVSVIDADQSRNAVLALVRSAVSNERAATLLREFISTEVLTVIAGLTTHEDAPLRASLVASQLVGVAMLRHVVRLGPLATATPDEIVALVAPIVEKYLR